MTRKTFLPGICWRGGIATATGCSRGGREASVLYADVSDVQLVVARIGEEEEKGRHTGS